MKQYLPFIALFSPITLHATPIHFDSVQAMMTNFNDYDPEGGNFKVLSSKPLSVTVSPVTVPGYNPMTVKRLLEKAAVYVAYRAFIHTDVNKITITAFPHEMDFAAHQSKYLKNNSIKFSITRSAALEAVQNYLDVNSLSELVEDNGTTFTDAFQSCCYLPEGKPGLKSFYATISKK